MSIITLDIPKSLRERLDAIAREEGVPLDQLIIEMVGKISSNSVIEKIKQKAKKRDTRAAFNKLLAAVPDVDPIHPDDVIK